MALFEDREKAFEQMFAHDEEARFRALAKRNRMLGKWAATELGLTGEKAEAYVAKIGRSVVSAVVDQNLAQKIRSDFEAAGIDRSDDQIREKMSELMATASDQVRSSTW